MIDKSMKYTACALFPIGLGIGFFANEVLTLIYGEAFIPAVLPLQILVVGTVVYGVVRTIGGSATAMGRPDLGLKIVGISATTNIVLNVLLIPIYGISGAATATTVSLLVSSLLGTVVTIKFLNVKIDLKWHGKLSGMAFLTILVFIYFEHVNVYLVGIALLCINLFLIFGNLLSKEDKRYFLKLIQR